MEHIFQSVLLLSGVGALITAVLLLIKPLTSRYFGSRWQYYIWLMVLLVMLLPVRFDISVVDHWTQTLRQSPLSEQMAQSQPDTGLDQADVPLQTEMLNPPVPADERGNLWLILSFVWLAGALLFLGAGLISYWRFLFTIRRHAVSVEHPMLDAMCQASGCRTKIGVKATAMLTAPLLTGLFRPTILLPDRKIDEDALKYILLHELTHYRRCDLWYKWFAFVVNAVHWFNPLVYLAVRQIGEECEICCDLAVTRGLNDAEKKAYMTVIMHLASNQKGGVKHVSKILYHGNVSTAQGAGEEV